MSGHPKNAILALAAAALAGSLSLALAPTLAPKAIAAEEPSWNGLYLLTLSANEKTGTSMAASQPEPSHMMSYTFSSSCSSGACIATVIDPPPPKHEFIPRPIEYTWNGSEWVREISWQWDCLLPDGSIEYNPAESVTVYTPGPGGILTGSFHTDISSGACKGTVEMPVSARPG
ncbi:hypothetical protein [Mycobacterium decipiens]|uniref:Secreted protein n=1 Tax=Mycobacterium decipiens TaxID=1430326 RepID=A0A1X2LXV3_9MYCO|nr:hypothetical protein [Mycobacterium decipiens]OSC41929.1 hypothetical protein B8W66_07155 [Mycobacterium decipiens]